MVEMTVLVRRPGSKEEALEVLVLEGEDIMTCMVKLRQWLPYCALPQSREDQLSAFQSQAAAMAQQPPGNPYGSILGGIGGAGIPPAPRPGKTSA